MLRLLALLGAAVLLVCSALAGATGGSAAPPKSLDVPYEPTHPQVVQLMLRLARVGPSDIVYDLGCGDGRIVVAAARDFGARGVGIDIDPQRIREARENAALAGVADKVDFKLGDIMKADFHEATVVTLYLLDSVNVRLRPRLFAQLAAGSRVVSHAFSMGDWEPDKTVHHKRARRGVVYLWLIPAHLGGQWGWSASIDGRQVPMQLEVDQEFQMAGGVLRVGEEQYPASIAVSGKKVVVRVSDVNLSGRCSIELTGQVEGDRISGTMKWAGAASGTCRWDARRRPVQALGGWRVNCTGLTPWLRPVRLRILRGEGGWEACQLTFADGRRTDVWHYYRWGGSVRIELPDKDLLLLACIRGDRMEGRLFRGGVSKPVPWTAVRVGR